MATNISKDLAEQLKAQIESFQPKIAVDTIGRVLEVGDGIARASGLKGVRSQELVQFENGSQGLAFNLEDDEVG
ncbi:MAG TPA: F0F1 ATP synthase subunit alpha, partial [Aggregatilineales bacterium]|nr:F0F1 ATP synthase subunit alpha [Aggregatilineales bacterium]